MYIYIKDNLPLPLLSCESRMFKKEYPDRKKNLAESVFKWRSSNLIKLQKCSL